MENITSFILVLAAAFMLFILFKILKKPVKLIFRLLLNTVAGFISLFAINYFGSFLGISLGVNWLNAIVIGVLGLPGVVLLLLLKYFL